MKSPIEKETNYNKMYPNKNITCFILYLHTILSTHIRNFQLNVNKKENVHSIQYHTVYMSVHMCVAGFTKESKKTNSALIW